MIAVVIRERDCDESGVHMTQNNQNIKKGKICDSE